MSLSQSVRFAWRSLRRTPVFTVAAVATLAIGIGASAAIFAVVDGVLLRPLPYGHPDRLVGAWHALPTLGIPRAAQMGSTYFAYKRFAHTIEGIAAYQDGAENVADPAGGSEPQRLRSATITASLIPLLQVSPKLGRSFTEAEDVPNGPAVVMISEGLWRTRFGGDRGVIGRMLQVAGTSRQIVGVMPESFRFPDARTELWLPLALDPHAFGGFNYNSVARLKSDVRIEDAERDFKTVLPRIVDISPLMAPGVPTQMLLDQAKPVPVLSPMREDIVGGVAGTLWIVAATAALVLLVACANVANLILVRADARQRELAVRSALGAGRGRVIEYFLTEAGVLAVLAGALGLAVATIAIRALVSAGPAELPRLAEVHVDWTVAAFTLVVAAVVAAGCSIIPALRYSGTHLATSLREGGRGGTAGRSRQRVRGALVAAQIALALVVLAGSALLLRSFQSLHAVRPGFEAEHVATLWTSLPQARYASDSDVARFYARLTDRVLQLPGIQSAGITSHLPLESAGSSNSPIWAEDDNTASSKIPPLQFYVAIDGGYFKAMGMPLLAGRTFDRIDGRQHGDEAIVSRQTAAQFWHDSTGGRAIGKRFRTLPNGPWYTVIGVVGGIRDTSLMALPVPTVYFPESVSQDTVAVQVSRTMALAVRTTGDPRAATRMVQRALHDLDATLPVFDARPMTEVMARSMAQLSFTMLVLGVAAAVTLLLGAIGLYGVIAYVVSMRAREFGVRIALGAQPRAVATMVTRQGITITGIGIVAGVVLFAFVARFLRAFLYGVAPGDPLTLVAVMIVLLGIAGLASWIPARRAAHMDPMEALRAE
jgi:putative ABC transport system permease protein